MVLFIGQNDLIHGWGMDMKLGYCAQVRVLNFFSLEKQIKNLKILKIPKDGKQRYVISILKIIECIHREFPKLEIQILGPPDVIVTYEQLQKSNRSPKISKC